MKLPIKSKSAVAAFMFDAGTYEAKLVDVKGGERRKFKKGPNAADEKEPALFVVFHLLGDDAPKKPDGTIVELSKVTSCSNYWGTEKYPQRSGLVNFLAAISPKYFNEADCKGNDEELDRRIQALIGKEFLLSIEPNAAGTFMNIKSAMLKPKAKEAPVKKQAPAPAPAVEPKKYTAIDLDDEDSVPF